jgi:hypothetical protein
MMRKEKFGLEVFSGLIAISVLINKTACSHDWIYWKLQELDLMSHVLTALRETIQA